LPAIAEKLDRMRRPLADYYHWEELSRGIQIYMHAAMVDRLQSEVLRGVGSDPGGREVGGILLGQIEEEGGKTAAIIDDFIPVECSYRAGPLYDVSGDDSVNLEAALLRAALDACDAPNVPAILGYYRSQLREGVSLAPSDVAVIQSYFQSPSSVFLLVKTVAGSAACTAGFFFWEEGAIQPEFSPLEVALGRTPGEPAAASAPEVGEGLPEFFDEGESGLPPELAGVFQDVPATFPDREPASSAARQPWPWLGLFLRAATILIATAALVIAVLAYLGAPRSHPPAAAAGQTSGLGLRVERNPPDLLVSWDLNAREIAGAPRATLSIRDGAAQHPPLNLDRAGILRGSYLYAPESDDVQFRLEVFDANGGSVAQSIRVSGSAR